MKAKKNIDTAIEAKDTTLARHPRKRFGCWFVLLNNLLILLLAATLLMLYYYLPAYVQRVFIPEISARYGISDLSGNVRHIGFSGADLGHIKIGESQEGGEAALEIASARADYSLTSLVFERTLNVERLTLSGMDISLAYKNGKLDLNGFPLERFMPGERRGFRFRADNTIKINFSQIIIEKAVLSLEHSGAIMRIPFDLTLTPDKGNWNKLCFTGKLYSADEQLSLSGSYDAIKQEVKLQADSKLRLNRLASFTTPGSGTEINGRASVKLTLNASFSPFAIQYLKVDGNIHQFTFERQGVSIAGDKTGPLTFSIKGQGKDFSGAISAFVFSDGSVPLSFKALSADMEMKDDGVDFQGRSMCLFNHLPGLTDVELTEPLITHNEFSAQYNYDHTWNLNFSAAAGDGKGRHTAGARYDDKVLSLEKLTLEGKLHGGNTSGGNITFKGESFSIFSNAFIFESDTVDGGLTLNNGAMTFKGRAGNVSVNSGVFDCHMPELKTQGVYTGTGTKLTFALDGASLSSEKYELKLNHIKADMPLVLSPGGNASREYGTLNIGAIQWKGIGLGALALKLNAAADRLDFSGELDTDIMPDMKLICSGHSKLTTPPEIELKVSLPLYKTPAPFKPGMYHPLLDGIVFDGSAAAEVDWIYTRGRSSLQCRIDVRSADIEMRRQDMRLQGADLRLALKDLHGMTSDSGQIFTFKSLDFKNLTFLDGNFDFKIDSTDSIRLDKASCSWLGGRLSSPVLKLEKTQVPKSVEVFCEGLPLAELINRLNLGSATSDGVVNGKLFLDYSNNGIKLKGGQFASPP
ncbi:MAG: YdbH domain-containing protein, partial [Victivallales bacterium]|nr:YdbH domain-containing protein [Victivallales bacterium]